MPSKSLSPPFADRELNGEILLDELNDLRGAGVGPRSLIDCALALRELNGMMLAEAQAKLKAIAGGRFQTVPELASLLVRWSAKLKSERDVFELTSHFERLAMSSALFGAMGRGASRLPHRGARR